MDATDHASFLQALEPLCGRRQGKTRCLGQHLERLTAVGLQGLDQTPRLVIEWWGWFHFSPLGPICPDYFS
jgi:hypothetical protein